MHTPIAILVFHSYQQNLPPSSAYYSKASLAQKSSAFLPQTSSEAQKPLVMLNMAVGHFQDLVSYIGTISHDCDETMDFSGGRLLWHSCAGQSSHIWMDQEG